MLPISVDRHTQLHKFTRLRHKKTNGIVYKSEEKQTVKLFPTY